MLIIPAIDIKDGKVVRFVRGRENKKVYSNDPVKTARHWVRQGAKFIHVIDLDGAITGSPKNLTLLKGIVDIPGISVEFGGGVRTIGLIRKLLDYGVWQVILGTKAINDKKFLEKAFRQFKEKIIVSLDAEGEKLLIKGWQRSFKIDVLIFARHLKEMGFRQVIYTDTSRDGTLKGPNLKDIKKLLKETEMEVIASGGISSLDDIHKLKILEKEGLKGVIVGKALYEGKFTLKQAIEFLSRRDYR